MFSNIITLDENISLALKNIMPQTPFFDSFFSFFSLSGNSILVWLLIMGFTIYYEERKNPGISAKDRLFTFAFFASFALSSFLSIYLFKNLFARPRPFFHSLSFVCPTDYSFPSAHAATAFAAASVLTCFDKKRGYFYYFTAVLIGYSRIYFACHYFLDVFFGAALGYLISKIFLHLINKK